MARKNGNGHGRAAKPIEESAATKNPAEAGEPAAIETDQAVVVLVDADDTIIGRHHVGDVKPFRIEVDGKGYERSGVAYGQAVYREMK